LILYSSVKVKTLVDLKGPPGANDQAGPEETVFALSGHGIIPKRIILRWRRSHTVMPSCSVIICTYNRAHLLKRVLHSLVGQTIGPDRFEVVVVDDGSGDDTTVVCDMMRSELPNLKYVPTGRNTGLSNARNVGISASVGDYLLFTDDDCIASQNWVRCLHDALDNDEIVAGAVASTTANFMKLCHNIAQFHAYMPGQKAGPKEMFAGANMAFRRSLLKELGGFFTGVDCAEDTEFILRARAKGHRVFFVPGAEVVHDPDRTGLKDIVRYAVKHASVTIRMRNHYRSLLKTPFVLRSPVLILATAPVIALTVTAGIYLRNPNLTRLFWTAPFVYVLKLAWCWGAARGLRNQYAEGNKKCRES
jgi:glycosyltransferase involved in cell wall biosynthesis